jgi:phosphoserine phosphatase
VARVVLGDAGLDLADEVGADVGRLGVDAATDAGEQRDRRATEPERRNGRFTGRVQGTPCFREGKVRRLDDWLGALGRRLPEFAESSFYSDSHNDLPLLERVTRPVAVDPDAELAAVAARRGWERISLRR